MNNFENPININNLIAKLDHILSRNDYNSAREFLEKWASVAQNQNDNKSLFSLCNECIGLYRKIGDKENCYKYGFIVRYGQDIVPLTGYKYEPWHVTYVGVDVAADMREKGITCLEEYVVKYIDHKPQGTV